MVRSLRGCGRHDDLSGSSRRDEWCESAMLCAGSPAEGTFQVLDVTDYLSKHPGGKRSILVPPRCKSADSAEELTQLEKAELTGLF